MAKDESTIKVFFERISVRRVGKTELRNDYSPVKGELISQN